MVMIINIKQSYHGKRILIFEPPLLPSEEAGEINTPLLRRGYHKLPTEH